MILLGRRNVDRVKMITDTKTNLNRVVELLNDPRITEEHASETLLIAMYNISWHWRGILTDWKETHD